MAGPWEGLGITACLHPLQCHQKQAVYVLRNFPYQAFADSSPTWYILPQF